MERMKRIWLACSVLVLSMATEAVAQLDFGTLSIINPSTLARRYQPFTDYLARELGQPVKLHIGRNYEQTLAQLNKGELDFAFIGPAPYTKVKENVELLATLSSNNSPFFHSVIVARYDSPLSSLKDLHGELFAFGSRHSTLSFYVPAHMLRHEGVLANLADYHFLNKHDRVAKHVILGAYAAGAVKESVYEKYKKYLKVIARSEPVLDFVMVCRQDLEPEVKVKLRRTLLGLQDTRALQALKGSASGFVAMEASAYDGIGEIVEEMDHLFAQ